MSHRTIPHPQVIGFSLIALLLMGGVVLYAIAAKNKHDHDTSLLVPTKVIDSHTSIGGQPTSETPPKTPPQPPHTQTTAPPVVQPPQPNTPASRPTPVSLSPKQDAVVASIEKELPYNALASPPNDPYYASSWAMQKTNATDAWNISTGSSVTVAVIDTGFALQHEDLSSQWAVNNGEQGTTAVGDRCWTGSPQNRDTNTCDDDDNGYIDDWRGWNFVSKTNLPQAGQTSTGGINAISHGTSVAGLIGAATNNSKGIATYNWNVKLMPLQALDDNGDGITSSIVAAIYYAVDNGASVINLSLGGPDSDPAVQAAIDYAYAQNVVVVAAAGNCGTTGDAGCGGEPAPLMMYPALSNHVIAVGAVDSTDKRASFSSYGPGLDVMAPGSGTIISPLIDTRNTPYNYLTAYAGSLYGTSFASPIVSGIAALIKSIRPSTRSDDITALINASATKVSAMNAAVYSTQYGHGLVNAGTAAVVANSLMQTQAPEPKLLQTGDYRSEHSISTNSLMSSGCLAAPLTYCTVRMNNPINGFDRYLPFVKTNAQGQAGWQWKGDILGSGEWSLRAMQGDAISASYLLFTK